MYGSNKKYVGGEFLSTREQHPLYSRHTRSCHCFKEPLHIRCQQDDTVYLGERLQWKEDVDDDGTIQTKKKWHTMHVLLFLVLKS